MALPKKLALQAWAPEIEGDGADLKMKVVAIQHTKNGRTHRTLVTLDLDRGFIKGLCVQIAAMQVRDRERIEGELRRLLNEIAPLVNK